MTISFSTSRKFLFSTLAITTAFASTAHAQAVDTGLVSKYIGETEKNLSTVTGGPSGTGKILVDEIMSEASEVNDAATEFDEADIFFAKRTATEPQETDDFTRWNRNGLSRASGEQSINTGSTPQKMDAPASASHCWGCITAPIGLADDGKADVGNVPEPAIEPGDYWQVQARGVGEGIAEAQTSLDENSIK